MRVSSPSRPGASSPAARVLVASSAMLAFISFWRVAAIEVDAVFHAVTDLLA